MKVREEIARKFDRYTLLHKMYGKWSVLVFLFGRPSMWGLIFKYILCDQCVEKFWKMQSKYGATVALEVSALMTLKFHSSHSELCYSAQSFHFWLSPLSYCQMLAKRIGLPVRCG